MTSSFPHRFYSSHFYSPPTTPRQNKNSTPQILQKWFVVLLPRRSHYPVLIISTEINPSSVIVTSADTTMFARSILNIISSSLWSRCRKHTNSYKEAKELWNHSSWSARAFNVITWTRADKHTTLLPLHDNLMVEVGKWSRCGCGAARVVKAGCSGGTVGKKNKNLRGVSSSRGAKLMLLISFNPEH